jgi:hypothetical protein
LRKEMKVYKEERRRSELRGVREKAAKWEEYLAGEKNRQEEAARRASGEVVEEEDLDLDSDEEVEDALLSNKSSPRNGSFFANTAAAAVPASSPAFFTAVPAPFSSSFPSSSSSGAEPSTLVSSGDVSTFFGSSVVASVTGGGVEAFRCEWRTGRESQTVPCGEVVASREELYEHVVTHARRSSS